MAMLPPNFFKDDETRKEFLSLQNKLVDQSRQLNLQKQTIQLKTQNKRRAEAYRKELEKVPAETGAFKAVGRMFLRTSITEAKAELDERSTSLGQDVANIQKAIEYLEKSLDTEEKSLKDLIEKQIPQKQ